MYISSHLHLFCKLSDDVWLLLHLTTNETLVIVVVFT